jgi:hypothetical protein
MSRAMTAAREDLRDLPDWPRRMSREQAAAYVGVSESHFDKQVRAGILPGPIAWGGRQLWDRKALDLACDIEIGLTGGTSPASDVDPISKAIDEYQSGRR